MTGGSVICENRLKDYGYEAFMQHKEEVCLAVKTVCFCLEFLQNQGNWSGRRTLWRQSSCVRLYMEEKKAWEKYDRRAIREALRELEEELKERKWRMGEEEIPLKNFLRQGFMLMTGKASTAAMTKEEWFPLIESQVEVNRFGDFREFLEAVYLLGFELMFEIQNGDVRSSLVGERRDAEHFLKALKSYIPAEGQPDYSLFSRKLLQEQEEERRDAMEQILAKRDERLQKTVKKLSLFRLFREAVENMAEEEFRELVEPASEEEEICGQEHLSEEEQDSIRRERKENRIRNLASAFVYGGGRARQRLLGLFSGEEQMLVMEQWIAVYYPEDEEMLENRLDRMALIAGLEVHPGEALPWREGYYPAVKEAREKLLGRKLQI